MRVRSVVAAVVVVAVAPALLAARARAQTPDPLADGLVPGDYLRVGVSSVGPVGAQGSLKDWSRGVGLGIEYENWNQGRSGVGRLGYGFKLAYSLLPFDSDQFLSDSIVTQFGRPITASAKRAGVFELGVDLRFRIPAPYIMPWLKLGLGFIDWAPGKITYSTATTSSQTAKQEHRSGGAFSVGAGLDKHIYDRLGVFAEAVYTYGYTSFGQGLAGSGSTCLQTNCDLLKNTPFGSIGGGVRVHIGN
jgi:Outer membrane protein beta-barrel domain